MFFASGKFSGVTGSPSGGMGLPGGIRRRKVGMFPAGSEGGTSRPGRDFFRRRKVAVFSPGGPGGKGPTGGRRSWKKRRMFVSGSKEVRQAVHATAVCRGPRQQRGHAAAAVARTVRNLWCSMTDLHEGRRWYGIYLFGAVPVAVAGRRARPGRCRCCTGYSNRRAKIYFYSKNNILRNSV